MPYSLTLDLNNNIYIADTNNNQIKKVNNSDTIQSSMTYNFNTPSGIAVDTFGNLYIVDLFQPYVIFIRITTGEQQIIQSQFPFDYPCGIAIDTINQYIYVADTNNNRVQRMNLDGTNTIVFTRSVSWFPKNISLDTEGTIFITDTIHTNITKIDRFGNMFPIQSQYPFKKISGIATDTNGYLYITDISQNSVIKMKQNGTNPVSIGYGFNKPTAIAIDNNGYLYITDTMNNRVIKMDTYGSGMTFIEDSFANPYSLCVDTMYNYIYVITQYTILKIRFSQSIPCSVGYPYFDDVIAKYCFKKHCQEILYNQLKTSANNPQITKNQQYAINIRTLKKTPVSYQGLLSAYNCSPPVINNTLAFLFNNPRSIATDQIGNIYVANLNQIIRMSLDGTNKKIIASGFTNSLINIAVNYSGTYLYITMVSSLVRINTDGTNRITLPPPFNYLYGIAVDQNGFVYATDTNRILIMDPNGQILIALRNDAFFSLFSIGVFGNDIYVISTYIDKTNNAIRFKNQLVRIHLSGHIVNSQNTITIPDSDVKTVLSGLSDTIGISVYNNNTIFITDAVNNNVFKIDGNGNIVYTYTYPFNTPYDVACDTVGNIYIADSNNNNIVKLLQNNIPTKLNYSFKSPIGVSVDQNETLYIIDIDSPYVCVLSNGIQSYIGNGLNNPGGIAVDTVGNYVYVADTNNKYIQQINIETHTSKIIGDGYFISPYGVAVDQKGTLYITDQTQVKKVDTNGILTVLPYIFKYPIGIAVDQDGFIYVADIQSTSIVKMTNNGIFVATIGYGFLNPYDVAVDSYGYVYVADSQNSRIIRMDTNGQGMTSFSDGILVPYSVAVDNNQMVYVVSSNKIISFQFPVPILCA